MDDSEIIDKLGGTSAVAEICKIKPPSVSEWRKNGIPDARRQFLELLRPDVFGEPSTDKREVAERIAALLRAAA